MARAAAVEQRIPATSPKRMLRCTVRSLTCTMLVLASYITPCDAFFSPLMARDVLRAPPAQPRMLISRAFFTMQLREDYEKSRSVRNAKVGTRPSLGWGVLSVAATKRGTRTATVAVENVRGSLPGSKLPEYVLYKERWLMLGIVSLLALLSDWACFAAVGGTKAWVNAFQKEPEDLIDIFLFSNVVTCFLYTDLTKRFGLKNVITFAAGLMATGCALRSGIHPQNLVAADPFVAYSSFDWSLPEYNCEIIGTILIGMAQPFFQCAPPLLSATWFGNKERSLSTAICLNANQLGIATAFVVGASMLDGKAPDAVDEYLSIITIAASLAFAGTLAFFKERPPTPPTGSAAAHIVAEEARKKAIAQGGPDPWITYPQTAATLLKTPGFLAPTLAFVGSIGVTNAVSAFTSETMHRAGFVRETVIDSLGAGFQVAVMLGGIVLGGYVDRSKEFKKATLWCFAVTLAALSFLGVAEGYDITLPKWAVVGGLLTLGAAAGPVQPINAELAVEVSYPSDENAVEATQQLCGNLFSALLVPLCVIAAKTDVAAGPRAAGVLDMRGDTLVLLALVTGVTAFFSGFNSPLKRAELDAEDVEEEGDYILHGGYNKVQSVWKKAALFESFAAAYNEPDRLREEAASLFRRIDCNQDGKLCRAEFIAGFPEVDEATADELIALADVDNSGDLDFEELWAVIKSVAEEELRLRR